MYDLKNQPSHLSHLLLEVKSLTQCVFESLTQSPMVGATVTGAERGLGKREAHVLERKLEQKPCNITVLCEECGRRKKAGTEQSGHLRLAVQARRCPTAAGNRSQTSISNTASLCPRWSFAGWTLTFELLLGRSHSNTDPKHLTNADNIPVYQEISDKLNEKQLVEGNVETHTSNQAHKLRAVSVWS